MSDYRVHFMFGNHTFHLCETIVQALAWLQSVSPAAFANVEVTFVRGQPPQHRGYRDEDGESYRARMIAVLTACAEMDLAP